MQNASNSDSVVEIEIRFQSKGGEWRWLRWRISLTGSGEPWLTAAARDITGEKLAQEKIRALADQVIIAQEDERRRISRELHDDVTQRLAALGIEMGLLKSGDAQHDPVIEQELTRLQGEVLRLSEDIRQLSHSLHPSVLEHSNLTAALEAYCHEFSRQTGIDTTFAHRNVPAEISQPVAIAFYRIAQEALRNVAVHSGATTSSVVLSGENLSLNVIDNGRGFDQAQAIKSQGLGLVSMEERARLVGAIVTIESIPGEGTTVSAEIPAKVQVSS
jgi:signal transduction histidine kinase